MIEGLLFLGIATTVVLGAVAGYTSLNETRKAHTMVRETIIVRDAVRQHHGATTVYGAHDQDLELSIVRANLIPRNMVHFQGGEANGIRNIYGGFIDTRAIGVGTTWYGQNLPFSTFFIYSQRANDTNCTMLMTSLLDGGVDSAIMGVIRDWGGSNTFALIAPQTPASIAAACRNRNNATIYFRFR